MATSIPMDRLIDIVRKYFSDEDISCVVEVGSMNGADAIYFKQEFPAAQVVAIEGLKENYENFQDNVVAGGVEWIHAVVTDKNDHVTFYVKKINGIHSIFDRGETYGEEERTVPCCRLDSLIYQPIDMMKIDVEGATLEVLKGMGRLLSTVKIMHIETESYRFFRGQSLHGDVAEFLEGHNFSMVAKADARIAEGVQHDSVWVKNEHLDSK